MAVYKDKKRGTWYTSFPYVDWTGKRCRKLKRGFLTKKEAQNWENHFKLQKANSLDMTFEDFYGIYEADVKPKSRYNTWCTKEHIIKTKILPYFKDLSMRDITPRDIIKWQNIMRESINNKGKEYMGTYLKTVQAQLSSIFNHAVRFYELPNNPVRVAGPMGQNESDEMKFWTKEEYMKFIPTMANKPYSYMAFELLYWCGIRLGELRALICHETSGGCSKKFGYHNKDVESCRDNQRSHVYSGSSDLPVRIPVVSDGADHHAVVPQA